jgi:HK97 family phage portal protein
VGLLSNLRGVSTSATESTVEAAFETPISPSFWTGILQQSYVTRQQAMTVPAVNRARNVTCGTIGSLPLVRYDMRNNTRLDPLPWQYQLDPDVPQSITLTWLVDSLFFFGVAYLQVLELYPDGRVQNARWISPERVQILTNPAGTEVTGYLLDGDTLPNEGVGSLKSFAGPDQGFIYRAGRTVQTALELEEAANRAAKEPMPQIILKNKGVNLGAVKVKEMLDGWKAARRERSTAYLNGDVDAQAIGFSGSENQLVESRQFHASEIARAANIPAWFLNADVASLTYSNVQQERRSLIDFSLRPLLTAIEERMSMQDFLPPNIVVKFDLDDFLRGSSIEEMQVMTGYVAAGIMTIGEARDKIDLIENVEDVESSSPRAISEMLQKIYLSVGVVITAEEAREIINRAGGMLPNIDTSQLTGTPRAGTNI